MALAGVHVSCVQAGMEAANYGANGVLPVYVGAPVLGENLTVAGTGTLVAPSGVGGLPGRSWIFRVSAAQDSWVVVGPLATLPVPGATTGYFVPVGVPVDIGVLPGMGWAWAAA